MTQADARQVPDQRVLRKLGIVIPTYDRPGFLLRTIRYLAAVGFSGTVYVGDSSSKQAGAEVQAASRTPDGEMLLKYVDCRGLNDRLTLARLAAMVETEYVAYIGDDDFLLPTGLSQCVTFLEKNPDFSAANGRAWAFRVSPDGPYGRMSVFEEYPQPELLQANAADRVEALLRNYEVTLFSVHRSAVWKDMWIDTPALDDRTFGAELLPCSITPVHGKTKRIECVHLMRQAHGRIYRLPSAADWFGSPRWREHLGRYLDNMARRIAAADGRELWDAKLRVEHAFVHGYLSRYRESAALFRDEAVPPAGIARRALRAIPGMRALFLRVFKLYWELRILEIQFRLKFRHARYSKMLLASWLDRSSPVYPDFSVLHRLVTSGRHAK